MNQLPVSTWGGTALLALAAALLLACPPAAWSVQGSREKAAFEEAYDPVAYYNKGVQEMRRGAFREARRLFEEIIRRHRDPWGEFGPAFGVVHYHAGLCLMQLRQYKKAAEQFRICYEDYPNHSKKEDSQNPFRQR